VLLNRLSYDSRTGASAVSAAVSGSVIDLSFTRQAGGVWYDTTPDVCYDLGRSVVYLSRGGIPVFGNAVNNQGIMLSPESLRVSLQRYGAKPCINDSTSYISHFAPITDGAWRIRAEPSTSGNYRVQILMDGQLYGEREVAFAHDPASVWRVVLYHANASASSETFTDLLLTTDGGNVTGTATTTDGQPVDRVVLHQWPTHTLAAVTSPLPSGFWRTYVTPGEYTVTYFRQGCAPIIHGPYLLPQEQP
jgi:hypothetical protein